MNEFDATEQAYKNGYDKGYADAKAELVRCKDCKYYNPIDSECTIKFDSSGDRLVMDAMHYCSDGGRRIKC